MYLMNLLLFPFNFCYHFKCLSVIGKMVLISLQSLNTRKIEYLEIRDRDKINFCTLFLFFEFHMSSKM